MPKYCLLVVASPQLSREDVTHHRWPLLLRALVNHPQSSLILTPIVFFLAPTAANQPETTRRGSTGGDSALRSRPSQRQTSSGPPKQTGTKHIKIASPSNLYYPPTTSTHLYHHCLFGIFLFRLRVVVTTTCLQNRSVSHFLSVNLKVHPVYRSTPFPRRINANLFCLSTSVNNVWRVSQIESVSCESKLDC